MSELEELGTQFDGEPAVVETTEVAKPEVETEKPGEVEEPAKVETEEEDKPHKKSGSQRAREKAMRLEVENQLLKEQLAGKKVDAPKPEGKPDPNQFEDHDAYVEALADWKVEEKLKARDADKKKQDALSGWEAKKEAARDKYEDFDDALAGADASPVVLQVMLDSPVGADLGYYLANNPKELKAINAMGMREAVKALDVLETKLTAPPKKTTQAPPPVVPVVSSVVVAKDHHSRFEEF